MEASSAAPFGGGLDHGRNGGSEAPRPSGLPCALVRDVEPTGERRWLVEGIRSAEAVGILGGAPKCGKTWFGLETALAVASGRPALGRFPVPEPGPVVIYPAEDSPGAVRERLDGLCRARGADLATLPLHIITAEVLRLDSEDHRRDLEDLLGRIRPRLLLLDPLVRLHTGDENHAGHISELMGYLRRLQRSFALSIMVTHHVSKKRHAHPGEALRGSSDLHAAGDSNAYLERRKDGSVLLTLEHRFAPSPEPFGLRLRSLPEGGARFEVLDDDASESEEEEAEEGGTTSTLPERVLSVLNGSALPLSQVKIRKALRVRNAELTSVLRGLESDGRIENLGRMGGWRTTPDSQSEDGATLSEGEGGPPLRTETPFPAEEALEG